LIDSFVDSLIAAMLHLMISCCSHVTGYGDSSVTYIIIRHTRGVQKVLQLDMRQKWHKQNFYFIFQHNRL